MFEFGASHDELDYGRVARDPGAIAISTLVNADMPANLFVREGSWLEPVWSFEFVTQSAMVALLPKHETPPPATSVIPECTSL
jgi:hypothetical protein